MFLFFKGYYFTNKTFHSTFSKMDAIHGFAREGEEDNLLKAIENGVSVNLKGLLSFLALHQLRQ